MAAPIFSIKSSTKSIATLSTMAVAPSDLSGHRRRSRPFLIHRIDSLDDDATAVLLNHFACLSISLCK